MKAALLPLCLFLSLAAAARAEDRIEQPVPVRTTLPVFPDDLRRAGVSGLVVVNCLVDEKGEVHDMRVERASNHRFEGPALEALGKWRFKPAERSGNKIAARVNIPIRFVLGD